MGVKRIILIGAASALLFSAGFGVRGLTTSDTGAADSFLPLSNDSSKFPMLAKRLFVENPNDTIINFTSLRKDLNNYMETNGLNGSLYFEYLPTGTSVRIDGDNEEIGASLLKVPAAMDLYKAAELGRVDLDKVVTLKQEWLNGDYGTLYKKGAGYQISLRDAAKTMLHDSDNTALNAIAYSTTGLLSQEEWIFSAIDVDITQRSDLTVSISARSYSSIIKCLYYSCFLNKQDSQDVLDQLTQTPFSNRLVAGIPDKSIPIAHKIGVANTTNQSDCGIVYMPNRNYLLCVMINGPDTAETNSHIAKLSQITYEFLSE